MKVVSEAYKAGMKGQLRNHSFVRVSFSNIDAEAATDGTWESNGAASYSEVSTLDYNYRYENTVGTLELNRWALDGKTSILPDSGSINDGFVSGPVSGNDGQFQTNPVLTREFEEPHTFQGITVTFDTRTNEWPFALTARFYLEDSVVDTVLVAPNDSVIQIPTTATNVDKIELELTDMLPYRAARIQYVMFGFEKIFENADLTEVTQSDDVDPLSRRLPIEKFTFTLLDYEHRYDPDNPQGEYLYVDRNSPISVQYGYEISDGNIEWIKADKYLLDGKPKVQNNRATFSATGLIGRLSDTFYKSKIGEKNFYDMAEEVLLDANLTPTERGENPWEIDDSLKTMYTTAVLPIATHMNCLQLIAHACRCRLYTDDDNIIHIERFGVTVKGIYSGEWEDNGHEWYSSLDTLDGGGAYSSTYTTLELNRWALDGSNQVIVPDSDPSGRGYVSDSTSNQNGVFEDVPVLTKHFNVAHDLPIVTIRFDEVLGEYPKEIQLRYYNGDNLLDTQTISNITGYEVQATSTALKCTKLEIAFLKGLPYSKARLGKVYYRETDFTLDFTSIAQDSQQISKIDQLKTVAIAKYTYTPEDSEGSSLENVDDTPF